MEELANLNIESPLKERIEFATPYVNVSRFRKLKILTLSDVILQVNIEFSEDGKELGSSNLYRIASGVWKCEEVITQMMYMRIRVVNQSGKINEKLIIKVTPVKLNEIYCPPEQGSKTLPAPRGEPALSPKTSPVQHAEPVQSMPAAAQPEMVKIEPIPADEPAEASHESVEEKKKRFKSPFSLRRSTKAKKTVVDYRFPDVIPPGCILIGGKNGSVQVIPLGNPGDVLMINDQGLPEFTKLSMPAYKPLPSLPAPSSLPPPLAKSNSSGTASQPSVSFDLRN